MAAAVAARRRSTVRSPRITASRVQATTNAWAPVAWDGVRYDTLGFWWAAAPTRLTVPPGVTRVRLTAGLRVDATDTMPTSNAITIRRGAGETVAESSIRTDGFNHPGTTLATPVLAVTLFGRRRRGFSSAQALHAVFPEAVTPGTGAPGDPGFVPWAIDAAAVVPLLVRELQLLRARVTALEVDAGASE